MKLSMAKAIRRSEGDGSPHRFAGLFSHRQRSTPWFPRGRTARELPFEEAVRG